MRAAPVARPYVSSLGAPPIEDIHNAIPPLSPPSGARIEREVGKRARLRRGRDRLAKEVDSSLRSPWKRAEEGVCLFVRRLGGWADFLFFLGFFCFSFH